MQKTQITLSDRERNFLQDTSTDLSICKSQPLTNKNAPEFATFLERLSRRARNEGYSVYVTLANACRKLVQGIDSETPHELVQRAGIHLKEALYIMHSSLHKIVIDQEIQASRMQFVRILSRIQRFSNTHFPQVEADRGTSQVSETAPAAPTETVVKTEKTRGYLIFRVNGRRYALPVESVVNVGRIGAGSWISKRVETKEGKFLLKDIKIALGRTGEAGNNFITVRKKGRSAIAWAVDGIEGIKKSASLSHRSLEVFGRPAESKYNLLIEGVLSDGTPGASILLVNPNYLSPVHGIMKQAPRPS